MHSSIIIYTDGSSIGNPGPGGWGAIIWYPEGRVVELGGRNDHTTNNRMEIAGAIEALQYVYATSKPVQVLTDSSYLINGITKWVHGWQRNGWITGAKEPVLNKELWEELVALTKKMDVTWDYTPGHAGVLGNERVDEIAQGFARREKVNLYEGSYEKYGIDLVYEGDKRDKKNISYLSFVGGVAMKHVTWNECKMRVEGKSGAKYKKAYGEKSEEKILKEWGTSLEHEA